ncbi:Rpr2-domain-containing protein [Pleurotus pulmonarius]
MAKKGKAGGTNPQAVPNRDIIQRMNFLYQASSYLNSIPSHSDSHETTPNRIQSEDISSRYIGMMKTVGQKTLVKIDPTVKRTLCKGCNTVLQPGINTTVRITKLSSHGHAVTYTCNRCKTSRRIPAPPTMGQSEKVAAPPEHHPESGDFIMEAATVRSPHNSKRVRPRQPPLFSRPGHVIFRGNEVVDETNQQSVFAA